MTGDFILYSFWARHNNEQNKKETYRVLKKLQLKMNKTLDNKTSNQLRLCGLIVNPVFILFLAKNLNLVF